jgi:hypothetical protein
VEFEAGSRTCAGRGRVLNCGHLQYVAVYCRWFSKKSCLAGIPGGETAKPPLPLPPCRSKQTLADFYFGARVRLGPSSTGGAVWTGGLLDPGPRRGKRIQCLARVAVSGRHQS